MVVSIVEEGNTTEEVDTRLTLERATIGRPVRVVMIMLPEDYDTTYPMALAIHR